MRFSVRYPVAMVMGWLVSATHIGLALADDYVDYDPKVDTPNVSAPLFVIISYSAIWIALAAFAIGLWRRQRQQAARIEELSRKVNAA